MVYYAISLTIMIYVYYKVNIFYCYHFLLSFLALGMVDINGTYLRGKYLCPETHFRDREL